MICHCATIRRAAREYGISKSTVHKDLTEKLPRINTGLYAQVKVLLDRNRAERHLRGGQATKRKYEMQKKISAQAESKE